MAGDKEHLTRILHTLAEGAEIDSFPRAQANSLVGQVFGRLTALAPTTQRRNGSVMWLCQCICGGYSLVRSVSLNRGLTLSCGCLMRENGPRNARCLPVGEAAFNRLLASYKRAAGYRHIGWDLTAEQFRKLTKMPCWYCGAEPAQSFSPRRRTGDYIYNGIDRADNTRGYTPDNAVPCCERCNRAKHVMAYEEFREWVSQVYSHWVSR